MLLPCSFVRLKELFQVKNGLTTSFLFSLFFFENGSVGLNGDEKEDGLNVVKKKNKKTKKTVATRLNHLSPEIILLI